MRSTRLMFVGLGAMVCAGVPRHAAAQAMFEGEISLKTPNGPVEGVVKGNKARLNAQTPMGTGAIFFNPAEHEIYIQIDAQRMVMVMKQEDAAQMVDSALRTTGTGTTTATGRTDTVAGHQCQIFRVVSATSAEDVCIASGLGNLGVMAIFGGGPSMGRGRPGPSRAPGWAGELARRGGVPLRVADTTGVVKFEVLRLESKPIPDSLVNPRADYQRMNMPAFGRPPLD